GVPPFMLAAVATKAPPEEAAALHLAASAFVVGEAIHCPWPYPRPSGFDGHGGPVLKGSGCANAQPKERIGGGLCITLAGSEVGVLRVLFGPCPRQLGPLVDQPQGQLCGVPFNSRCGQRGVDR